jgi:predicted RNA-binding protein with PUA-like domain
MNYWLVKQEPEKYSFDDLVKESATEWTGVRNFQARNNLRAMKTGDAVLFYHSVSEKAVVGAAKVSKEAFQDSTDETGKWIAVEIKPVEKFVKSVSLEEIKTNEKLQNIGLIKQSRLSIMPLSREEFEEILSIAKG